MAVPKIHLISRPQGVLFSVAAAEEVCIALHEEHKMCLPRMRLHHGV